MKKMIIIKTILFLFLFSISSQENKSNVSTVIDVEHSLKNLTHIKVSDLGKTIRYIPLETPDNGLVGRDPIVKVLKNFIVVEYRQRPHVDAGVCLLFNKEDGRFISKIGHEGQDPAAYSNSFSWTDEKEEFLYFHRQPNQLVKYDMKGNFCGKVEFSPSVLASYYVITDSEIIGYFDSTVSYLFSNQSIGFFEKDGRLKDTIPSFFSFTMSKDDLYQISVPRGQTIYNFLGSWGRAGVFLFEYTSAKIIRQIHALNAARIWKNNNNIRFKHDFIDTIFTVSGSKLIPSFVLNTGKFHWPVQERRSEKNNNERVFIADIYENNNFIFFQCIKGMFSGKPILYNSLYYKNTGEMKLCKNEDGIEDDITHFLPFKPLGMSTSGEFISLIEAWKAIEWLNKHPAAKNDQNLSFLKTLDGDMNPIVILIE